MKPDKNATNNLIDKIRIWTPCSAREILKSLKRILPILEESDSIANEVLSTYWICFKDSDVNEPIIVLYLRSCYEEEYKEEVGSPDLIIKTLRTCVQEFDHYIPSVKAQIVDAALAKVSGLAEKAERLKEMLPKVKELCDSLDKRTKEIITIVRQLMDVETNICPEGYKNYYCELFKSTHVNISVLRDEFSVKPLIEAYDLAVSVSEEMTGGQQGTIGPSPVADVR